MLDMRPGNIPGLTRGAYLRELFGDIEGAIEFFDEAFRAMRESEVEDRAWMLTQIAHLRLAQGKVDSAEKVLGQALELFPDYHYALAQLAKVKLARGDAAAAAELFEQRYQLAPHPENLYDVACALERAGQVDQAHQLFRQFEQRALAESKGWDNANKELVFYYADHASADGTAVPAEKALEIAALEIARRRDVLTLDAYAWALHRNGRDAEAQEVIEEALQVGIQDARMLYHAGAIEAAARDEETASRRLHASLEAEPTGETAGKARELLARIEGVPVAGSQ
jgi:tetratricopeptide (TPR) repeat protein